jgi:GNAT superfamily N-acetyltransferase
VDIDIKRIPPAASYPLRQAVLRPHQRIDEMGWAGDEEPGAATFGAVERTNGTIVGVATVFPEAAPFDPAEAGVPSGAGKEAAAWRSRGMATSKQVQGQSIGSLVLKAVFDHVATEGGDLLWCNARVSAVGFYERAGFGT